MHRFADGQHSILIHALLWMLLLPFVVVLYLLPVAACCRCDRVVLLPNSQPPRLASYRNPSMYCTPHVRIVAPKSVSMHSFGNISCVNLRDSHVRYTVYGSASSSCHVPHTLFSKAQVPPLFGVRSTTEYSIRVQKMVGMNG